MNVKKLSAGAWLELDPIDEKIGQIKLLVKPIPHDFEVPKDNQGVIDKMASLIQDWNLTEDDKPIPCNEETRKVYFPFLLRVEVKGPEEKEYLGAALMRFASSVDNFLKN